MTAKEVPFAKERPDALAHALKAADLRVLLMAMFHVSGDFSWLDYKPVRDATLVADESAGFAPDIQEEIRSAAYDLLHRSPEPVVTNPDEALLLRMLRTCLAEEVGEEYAALMREEMGFASRDVARNRTANASHSVLIVGAGVSGIALGSRLCRLGIDYQIVERNEDVGGVWLENRYPGCGVDTPNHAYAYSFSAPYPWRRYFSDREQVHDYLSLCADAHGVREKISFGTDVTAARWLPETQCWAVDVRADGHVRTIESEVLVSAIGQLSDPSVPSIKGLEQFEGLAFHSAYWPDGLDLTGKRVALIGTGASAMQIGPSIADKVASLAIYQRSPQWARPVRRHHEPISEGAQWLMDHVPYYAQWFRTTMWWRYGDGLLPQLRRDPNWPDQPHSINKANARRRAEMMVHMEAELEGREDLLAACTPHYPPFGKRILLDNGWYATLRQPNVELIPFRVDEITSTGVIDEDGEERAADVIIFATGFNVGQMAARLNITGRGGTTLADRWAEDNPNAYLGITVSGFPNLFLMGGPNTGLAHGGSTMFQAESQARYITSTLVAMAERDVASAEVRSDVHDAFVRRVDAEHAKLIWTHPSIHTYHKNSTGRVISAMPFRLVDYWRMTHDADLSEYELQLRA
jgi:4-hydroxyacetophenone monooxygenase